MRPRRVPGSDTFGQRLPGIAFPAGTGRMAPFRYRVNQGRLPAHEPLVNELALSHVEWVSD
jgi:hypothetical protein